MIIDPIRWYRRNQRLKQDAKEEILYLKRRHGGQALAAAREKLSRPDLTDWGRSVVGRAIRELERAPRRA
jgi:hypothetical protein